MCSVERIEIKSSLKQRALGVHGKETDAAVIDPDLIAKGEREIKKFCTSCTNALGDQLDKLTTAGKIATDGNISPDSQEDLRKTIFLLAHNLKDTAAMCEYDLIAYFSQSLRDYMEDFDMGRKAHKIILQAHIDALNVAHKNGYKKNGGAAAEELKAMVRKAIDQNT